MTQAQMIVGYFKVCFVILNHNYEASNMSVVCALTEQLLFCYVFNLLTSL